MKKKREQEKDSTISVKFTDVNELFHNFQPYTLCIVV